MGLIKTLIRQLKSKKVQHVKTQPSEDIQYYIDNEKQKLRIQAIKDYEKNSFLYGRSVNQDG